MSNSREDRDAHYQHRGSEDAVDGKYNPPPHSIFPRNDQDLADTKAYKDAYDNTREQTRWNK